MLGKFWKKKTGEPEVKLKDIPDVVGGHLVTDYKEDPDWAWKLKAFVQPRPENPKVFDIKLFDVYEAANKNIKIKDVASLDQHPELIVYQGWYCKDPPRVQLEKRADK